MHGNRAAVMCTNPKILAQLEDATPEQKLDILSVWRTQYGVGRSGNGATGYKLKPARRLARIMAENARKYAPKRRGK